MAKANILLVDADARSARLLEVSLKQAGYNVTLTRDGARALEAVAASEPALIITDTRLPTVDGYELVRRLRANIDTASIPIVFLTSQSGVEDKIRGLELGVDEYLTKPIFVRELLTRVRLLLVKRAHLALSAPALEGGTIFRGNTFDMGVADLLQTFDVSRKSGVLRLTHRGQLARIFFHDGKVTAATLGGLAGEEAIYRTLIWSEAEFEVDFGATDEQDSIGVTTQAVLMEGLRRLDEWSRIREQLPGLDEVYVLDDVRLRERLRDVPEELHGILRLFDGRRTLMAVVDESPFDDLSSLTTLAKLYFEGLLLSAPKAPAADERATASHATLLHDALIEESTLTPAPVRTVAERAGVAASDVPRSSGRGVAPSVARSLHDNARAEAAKQQVDADILAAASALAEARARREPSGPDGAISAPLSGPVLPKISAALDDEDDSLTVARAASEPLAFAPSRTNDSDKEETASSSDVGDSADDDVAGLPPKVRVAGTRFVPIFVAIVLGVFLLIVFARYSYRGSHDTSRELAVWSLADSSTSIIYLDPHASSASESAGSAGSAGSDIAATAERGVGATQRLAVDAAAPTSADVMVPGVPSAPAPIVANGPASTHAPVDLSGSALRALESGKPRMAAEIARNAVIMNPKDPVAWLTLGAAYDAQGNKIAAKSAYRSCVAQAEGPRVSECRDLLGQ